MNKSAVSVLLFALFHSRNPNKMVNIVLEQSLARIKNHIFLIAQSWDVKLKLMPYLSWFSAQFWKRSKFLLFASAYHYQHIFDIFLVFLLLLCPWFSLFSPIPGLRCYPSCTEHIDRWVVLSPVPAFTGNKIMSGTMQIGEKEQSLDRRAIQIPIKLLKIQAWSKTKANTRLGEQGRIQDFF